MSIKNLVFFMASLAIGGMFIATALGLVGQEAELRQSGVKTTVLSISHIQISNQHRGSSPVAQALVVGERYSGEVTFKDGSGTLVSANVEFSPEIINRINSGKSNFVLFNPKKPHEFILENGDGRPKLAILCFGGFFILTSIGFFKKIKARSADKSKQENSSKNIDATRNGGAEIEVLANALMLQAESDDMPVSGNAIPCRNCSGGHIIAIDELIQSENSDFSKSRPEFIEPTPPKNRILVAIAIGFVVALIVFWKSKYPFSISLGVALSLGIWYYMHPYYIKKSSWEMAHRDWSKLMSRGYYCNGCNKIFISEHDDDTKQKNASTPMPLA